MPALDAVLPLTARDSERASILARSLERHFSGLGTLWAVTPDADCAALQRVLGAFSIPGELRVIPETELVPELAHARPWLRGWYRQQLVKLAIAARIQTDNYLTLDADVICVRPVTPAALAPDGRGLCHVLADTSHDAWYRGSSELLGLPCLPGGTLHNLTPAILNREAVLDLQRHLCERAVHGIYRRGLRGLRQRALLKLQRRRPAAADAWRLYLIAGTPWTEYTLYYTFLEASDRFERYHARSEFCIYAVEGSIWRPGRQRFEDWEPKALFEGEGPPYFALVQSIADIAPARVWTKVAPYLSSSHGSGRAYTGSESSDV